MDINLSPKLAKKVYGGNGGSYYAWSPSELPMLHQGNIGAAKLALDKNGLLSPFLVTLILPKSLMFFKEEDAYI